MDLSNLSFDLPPTKPVSQTAIDDLSRDLTTEFKNAAKSVAKLYNSSVAGNSSAANHKAEFANAAKSVAALYRTTHNATSLLQHNGYLNCLDDLLDIIAHDGDVENWALTKRAEITNMNNVEDRVETSAAAPSSSESFQFPHEFKFSFTHDMQPKAPFVPGMTPLSVDHLHYRSSGYKPDYASRDNVVSSPSKSSSSSDEDLEDRVILKKMKHEGAKKKWKKTMSDHNKERGNEHSKGDAF